MARILHWQSLARNFLSISHCTKSCANPITLQNSKHKTTVNSLLCQQISFVESARRYSSNNCKISFLRASYYSQIHIRHKYRKAKLTKREQLLRKNDLDIFDIHGKDVTPDLGFDDNLSLEERTSDVFDKLLTEGRVTKVELNLRDTIQGFIEAQCDKGDIEWIFENHPDLIRRHAVGEWMDLIQCLQTCGFFGSTILHIAAKNPLIFRASKENIVSATAVLCQVFKTEARMCRICSKHPHLLTFPAEYIDYRYSELSATFAQNDLLLLVNRNPSLFLDDIEEIQTKLDYIIEVLNVPEKEVVDSKVFSHSLQHIITRSEFLVKSGLYERPDKHGHSPVYNAPLKDIVDTKNSLFSRNVAHCSLSEYEAYCKMFDLYDERSVENVNDFDDIADE